MFLNRIVYSWIDEFEVTFCDLVRKKVFIFCVLREVRNLQISSHKIDRGNNDVVYVRSGQLTLVDFGGLVFFRYITLRHETFI